MDQAQVNRPAGRLWIVALVASLVSACTPDPQSELKIGLTVWPPNEIAYLARDLGSFDDLNIRLIEDGTPSEYAGAFASGAFDGAVATLGTALHVCSTLPDHRIVLLVSYSAGGDALVVHDNIKSAEDLAGKRVGYEPLALGTFLLSRFLQVNQLRVEDVVPVPLDMAEHHTAFTDGRVDAVVSFDPTVSAIVAAGGRILTDSRSLPGEVMDVLIVHKSVLDQKRELLTSFVDAWFEALAFHSNNPSLAAQYSEDRNHFSRSAYLAGFEGVIMLDRAANQSLFSQDDSTLLDTLGLHGQFLSELGLIESSGNFASILDSSIIAAVPAVQAAPPR